MEITFLGTASAYPTPTRGVSCVIFRNDGAYWMFDCGEGSQIQLMKSPVRPGKISKIFISHLHGDHMFGLPGLLCTVSQNFSPENKAPLELYGPEGLRKFVRVSLELSRSLLGFNYMIHELKPLEHQYPNDWLEWPVQHSCEAPLHPNELMGKTISADEEGIWHVCEDEQMFVRAAWLEHRIPSYGFVIEEKPTPGKLDAAKLKKVGIPPGPLYAKVKAGESVTAPGGEIIHPADVLGPERPGRKVAILGDTCENSTEMALLCQNANVLIHEATLEDDMKENAVQKGHSTPNMAGTFAQNVNVDHLVLTHFSQRYKPLSAVSEESPEESADTVAKLVIQAKAAFGSESVTAAEDLMTVKVPLPSR